jgi:hypothetical protein
MTAKTPRKATSPKRADRNSETKKSARASPSRFDLIPLAEIYVSAEDVTVLRVDLDYPHDQVAAAINNDFRAAVLAATTLVPERYANRDAEWLRRVAAAADALLEVFADGVSKPDGPEDAQGRLMYLLPIDGEGTDSRWAALAAAGRATRAWGPHRVATPDTVRSLTIDAKGRAAELEAAEAKRLKTGGKRITKPRNLGGDNLLPRLARSLAWCVPGWKAKPLKFQADLISELTRSAAPRVEVSHGSAVATALRISFDDARQRLARMKKSASARRGNPSKRRVQNRKSRQ